jgi:hypothetical protein
LFNFKSPQLTASTLFAEPNRTAAAAAAACTAVEESQVWGHAALKGRAPLAQQLQLIESHRGMSAAARDG